jgi:predicted DNA binding CopG/RHH family protein
MSYRSTNRSFSKPLKSISPTKTKQTDDSCGAHALSRLILKNVFEVFYPLNMTKKEEELYEIYQCNQYLITGQSIEHLTLNCGINGYYKILLFLYVYYLTVEKYGCEFDMNEDGMDIIDIVLTQKVRPTFFKKSENSYQWPLLEELLRNIKEKIKKSGVRYQYDSLINRSESIIRKVLDGNLYVVAELEPKYKQLGEHACTIVAHTPSRFIIKNSWDETS